MELYDPIINDLIAVIYGPDGVLDELGIRSAEAERLSQVFISEGPTVLTFFVTLLDTARDTKRLLAASPVIEQHVAAVLGYAYGTRCPVRVTHGGASIGIQIPHPRPHRPTLQEIERDIRSAVLFGISEAGQPLFVDILRETDTGIFVVGESGSGKTNAMVSAAVQLLERKWELAVVDLKGGRDWYHLERYACHGYAEDHEGARRVMETVLQLVNHRNSRDYQGKTHGIDTRPVLFVFDELSALDKREQQELAMLATRGRSAGVRLLLGSQRAGKEVHELIRANVPARLVGRVSDHLESQLAFGKAGVGAEALLGKGDMIWKADGKSPVRVQVAQVLDDGGWLPHTLLKLRAVPEVAPAPVSQNGGRPTVTLEAVMTRLREEAAKDPRRSLLSEVTVRRVLIACQRLRRPLTQAEVAKILKTSRNVRGADQVTTLSKWKREILTDLQREVLGLSEPHLLAELLPANEGPNG